MDDDFKTDNLLVKCTERYGFKLYDWRGIFGQPELVGPDGAPLRPTVPAATSFADPNFTLSELEEAQDLIEKLKK